MTPTFRLILSTAFVAVIPFAGFSAGNHYGWCNGVGNNHAAATCGPPPSTDGTIQGSVPTSNQLPHGGTLPTPDGTPATIYVTPVAPTPITGTGRVPPVEGQVPAQIVGIAPGPITIEPVPQTVFTGVGPVPPLETLPVPSFTGSERQPIVIRPLPPSILTGTTSRGNVQPIPAPSFTGQGLPTIIVVPNTPTTLVGYGPVASALIVEGTRGPGFSGTRPVPPMQPIAVPGQVPTATPPATPVLAPSQAPAAIPVLSPQLEPGATPTATPVLVPRPRPERTGMIAGQPSKVTHKPTATAPGLGKQHVTDSAGRQAAHTTPRFSADDGGRPWHCVASGHGKRRSLANSESKADGALRHVGSVDVLGRDLPALHPGHSHCIIVVRRRTER